MPTIVGVKLEFAPSLQQFDSEGIELVEGDHVIVETERGTECGRVVEASHEVDSLPAGARSVIRAATPEDVDKAEDLAEQGRAAMSTYRELIAEHGLDMKPVDVEFMFDGSKVVFYFTAEERVDFRDLVRDLASRFKARIDMRQVGVRDEARMVGGLGHCGQVLCCTRFPGEFHPVSIRMAKEQDLPLNPLKISGVCGRLMCCLRYEFEAYKDFKSRAPKRKAIIETPLGLAKVRDYNTPRETVTLRLESGDQLVVPVDKIGCCKGKGCPCSVSQEALDEIQAAEQQSVTMTAAVPELTSSSDQSGSKPSRRPSEETGGGDAGEKKPRRRPRGGRRRSSSDGSQKSGEASTKSSEAPSKDASQPREGQPSQRSRRSRSRKPKNASTGAQQASTGQQPQKRDAQQDAAPSTHRRRRRRRPPQGGQSTENG